MESATALADDGLRTHVLQCMEIFGGNAAIERTVRSSGLDAWIHSQPYKGEEQGGDVHYLSLCGGALVTRMIIADVSGHGGQVAKLSSALRGLMRKHINAKSQTKLVQKLNQEFVEIGQWSRFATAVAVTYLADRDILTLCNAGHPRPIWRRAREGSWSILDRDLSSPSTEGELSNLPLGMDEDTVYRQFTVKLDQGDIVLFYTDALTESTSPEGKGLGETGLLELATQLDADDPATLGPRLLQAIADYRGGEPADDDVTLLMLHHNSGRRRMTLGDKVSVYAKVFGLKSY